MKQSLKIIAGLVLSIGLAAGVYHYFFKPVSVDLADSRKYTDEEVIEQALHVTLLACEPNDAKDEIEKYVIKIFSEVGRADYKMALKIAMDGLQKYPHDFVMQHDFTSILGDYSELFSGSIQEQMVQKSKQAFEKLMLEVQSQSVYEKFYFINEYCFRLKFHQRQYENGKEWVAYSQSKHEMVTGNGIKGYYCQGVGAVYYAKQLLTQKKTKLAQEWAQKSLVAWAQYFTYKNDYYNSYVHYALALGILGYRHEMMQALQKSADMIKKDMNYKEFKDVIDFVESLK